MSASEQVTGPVAVWVAVPIIKILPSNQSMVEANTIPSRAVATNKPLFLGWGESAPEPEFLPEYEPIMSDLRGSRKAHDRLFEGGDARVTLTMTIWDELVLQACLAFVRTGSQPGMDGVYDTGTLMNAEKSSYQMWLNYQYATARPFMVAAGMLPGYRALGAMLDGPIRRQQGTKVNKVLASWYWSGVLQTAIGGYKAYDNDMTALNGLVPTLNRP